MLNPPTHTTTELLDGLFDPTNETVWHEFDLRYRPILVGVARKLGCTDEDAADIAQDTLVRFLNAYREGKYDRGRGRLRAWLVGIVRNQVIDQRRAWAARREHGGESVLAETADETQINAVWEIERRVALLRQAVAELREQTRLNEKTIRAFELYVLEGRSPEAVAAELGMAVHDVYMAKNRIAERLRQILKRLENLFDDG